MILGNKLMQDLFYCKNKIFQNRRETMINIKSYYVNPNNRVLTSNIKNTELRIEKLLI